jgi:small subunit ribosomal protein S15
MATNKKITKILREHDITFKLPEDLKNLMKHAVKLNTHVEHNPKDHHNRRGLQLIEAKIRRLSRYYIRKGVLPHDWKYSLETAKLLVD